jgi:aminoglycoside/choline kinase family phosphotransferase
MKSETRSADWDAGSLILEDRLGTGMVMGQQAGNQNQKTNNYNQAFTEYVGHSSHLEL